MVIDSIVESVGKTPVVHVNCFREYTSAQIFLKLEYFNPTSSIKDRPSVEIIKAALKQGDIKPGGTVIESTSGNFGKSLSMLCAAHGLKAMVVLDPKASDLTVRFCKALGAEVVMVDQPDEHGSYQTARTKKVQELLQKIPGSYNPNQYRNPNNPWAHERHTSQEIIGDFERLDAFVACISTGGHFSGISKVIKKEWPSITCVAADAEGSSIITGTHKPYLMNGIGLSWQPDTLAKHYIDKYLQTPCIAAFSICRYVAKHTGILLGGSSGASLYAALSESRDKDADYKILAVAPDYGVNYLDQFYDDTWLNSKGIKQLPDIDQVLAEIDRSVFMLPQNPNQTTAGVPR